MPFIGILTNLYTAIYELAGNKDQSRSAATDAAQSLSPDLSKLNQMLDKSTAQAASALSTEEVKMEEGTEDLGAG